MTEKELKNSILQQAVEGKLVPQNPADAPASELLKQIEREKARLVKEGKIKKPKDASTIFRRDGHFVERKGKQEQIIDAELPFDIPDTWEWVRLGEVCNIVSARRVHKSDWQKKGVPFYRAREIVKLSENGKVNNDLFITEELYKEFSKSGIPKEGDLMVTAVGTLGKTYIVTSNDRFYYKDASVLCFENFSNLNAKFLKFVMDSSFMSNQIEKGIAGTTVATITIVKANSYLFPLPPLAEQERIVAKLDQVLPLVGEFGKIERELTSLEAGFPQKLKNSVLQQAVEGKLVPQDPADEPASELLKQIEREKARLVKEGKIKKPKDASTIFRRDGHFVERKGKTEQIIDSELPFDIPDTWEWVRLGEVCQLLKGEAKENEEHPNLDAKFLRGQAEPKYIKSGNYVPKNDTIILVDGENSGEVFITPVDGYLGSTFKQLWISPALLKEYVLTFVRKNKELLRNNKRGAAIPHLDKSIFFNLFLPLPPLAEQERIVEKLDVFTELEKELRAEADLRHQQLEHYRERFITGEG